MFDGWVHTIQAVSFIAQAFVAIYALSLLPIARYWSGWYYFALAMLIMLGRRTGGFLVDFFGLEMSNTVCRLGYEGLGLITSVLLLVAVIMMEPILQDCFQCHIHKRRK